MLCSPKCETIFTETFCALICCSAHTEQPRGSSRTGDRGSTGDRALGLLGVEFLQSPGLNLWPWNETMCCYKVQPIKACAGWAGWDLPKEPSLPTAASGCLQNLILRVFFRVHRELWARNGVLLGWKDWLGLGAWDVLAGGAACVKQELKCWRMLSPPVATQRWEKMCGERAVLCCLIFDPFDWLVKTITRSVNPRLKSFWHK